MSDVHFSGTGPDETILPDPDPELVAALDSAAGDRAAIRRAVERFPAEPLAWATYADATRAEGKPAISVYAYYRVGYHRGLDSLRKHGWKGSGYVRSEHPSNQGFLRCLKGLGDMAAEIGETEEAERCRQFLQQLDPGLE
jgi:hypothetical protein